MHCSKCEKNADVLDERMVRDVNNGTIFCKTCADALSRVCYSTPAIIRSESTYELMEREAAERAAEPIPGDSGRGRRACERNGGHKWHDYLDAGCLHCGASDKYRNES